jgi:hypothetical protein
LAKNIFKEITTNFVRKKDAFFTCGRKISGVKILTNFMFFSYKLKQDG